MRSKKQIFSKLSSSLQMNYLSCQNDNSYNNNNNNNNNNITLIAQIVHLQ